MCLPFFMCGKRRSKPAPAFAPRSPPRNRRSSSLRRRPPPRPRHPPHNPPTRRLAHTLIPLPPLPHPPLRRAAEAASASAAAAAAARTRTALTVSGWRDKRAHATRRSHRIGSARRARYDGLTREMTREGSNHMRKQARIWCNHDSLFRVEYQQCG